MHIEFRFYQKLRIHTSGFAFTFHHHTTRCHLRMFWPSLTEHRVLTVCGRVLTSASTFGLDFVIRSQRFCVVSGFMKRLFVDKVENFPFSITRWRLRIPWRNRMLRTVLTVYGHAHTSASTSGWDCAIKSAHCCVVCMKSARMSRHVHGTTIGSRSQKLSVWQLVDTVPCFSVFFFFPARNCGHVKQCGPKHYFERSDAE